MDAISTAVVIEVSLHGARGPNENPAIPHTPAEVAAEARRAAAEGAAVVHFHARAEEGGWRASVGWYAEAIRLTRKTAPETLTGITSIRPAEAPIATIVDLLVALGADPATRPDLVSVNLGQTVAWEPTAAAGARRRRTVHVPNDYEEVAALLATCRRAEIVPELGVMDLGFVSNAVALRDDGLLPDRPWFLLELDSPRYGASAQVAPATLGSYDALAGPLREHFPGAAWAAQGHGLERSAVLRRTLADGAHVRVGFEDVVHLPDGTPARSNAEQVALTVAEARRVGREPATRGQAGAVIGLR